MRFFFVKEEVERQTVQNLIDAGCLTSKEAKGFIEYLGTLDPRDLLANLMESW